jgi:hypothetical protein
LVCDSILGVDIIIIIIITVITDMVVGKNRGDLTHIPAGCGAGGFFISFHRRICNESR